MTMTALQHLKTNADYHVGHVLRLREVLSRAHPGSQAEARIKAELYETEITAGLWLGRLNEAEREENAVIELGDFIDGR